jgi:deoxyribodipyrimidine photo-lyase
MPSAAKTLVSSSGAVQPRPRCPNSLPSRTRARCTGIVSNEPASIARDAELREALEERGLDVEDFPGNLLFEPGTIRNAQGDPYRVFTPFWKACLAAPPPPRPTGPPAEIRIPSAWPDSSALADLARELEWNRPGLRESWRPGERAAAERLGEFLDRASGDYAIDRDRPERPGTSRLSPHLHFGELSARQIWHAVSARQPPEQDAFLRQIVWREFAHHLLFHFPQTLREPLRPEFVRFPWRVDAAGLEAWTNGRTGYPMVDAGMRELRSTGWMHNRVRMIAASFLVKHLLIPWQEGAAWFWDTLVDADLANNTLGWQWVAGCGADAAPYFRIFNPVLQGEKFDPNGNYVRRWAPELAPIPARWIHRPWEAPTGLAAGTAYPAPIVNHGQARMRALAAFARISKPAVY